LKEEFKTADFVMRLVLKDFVKHGGDPFLILDGKSGMPLQIAVSHDAGSLNS
jgi:hypothetical protein